MVNDKTLKLKLKPSDIRGVLFIYYFCNVGISLVLNRVFGSGISNVLYNIGFFLLLLVSIKNIKLDLQTPFIMYFTIALLFLFTMLIHPEYGDWFNHRVYGVIPAFLNFKKGIWAFWVVWLVKDDEKFCRYLHITSWILFIVYLLQFVSAMRRGYWIDYDITGVVQHQAYDLEFGYNMLLPTAFFGAYAFIKKYKLYYIPFVIGIITIMVGGSRGAIIWPFIMILLLFIIGNREEGIKRILVILGMVLLVLFIYLYWEGIILAISVLLERFGLSSRSISTLLTGTFGKENGRTTIYGMALELIKTGGPFGHGIYGDRYVIGNYFPWGYSHNIFLELLVSFGYFGGSILSAFLIIGIIRLFKSCQSETDLIIVTTLFTASLKLMLSNSFWYTAPFWALLSLILGWRLHSSTARYTEQNNTMLA